MIHKGLILDNVRINAPVATVAILFGDAKKMSFHNIITGTPSGTLKLQASDDLAELADGVISWVDITGSLLSIATADQYIYNINSLASKWVRLVYIPSAGDGFITTTFYGVA